MTREVRRLGDQPLHRRAVELAVGLGARALHGRALAAVEDAELDAGGVGGAAHQPVERVDLAHEMALAEAADRRIAGHLADRREALGDERRARAERAAAAAASQPAWPPPMTMTSNVFILDPPISRESGCAAKPKFSAILDARRRRCANPDAGRAAELRFGARWPPHPVDALQTGVIISQCTVAKISAEHFFDVDPPGDPLQRPRGEAQVLGHEFRSGAWAAERPLERGPRLGERQAMPRQVISAGSCPAMRSSAISAIASSNWSIPWPVLTEIAIAGRHRLGAARSILVRTRMSARRRSPEARTGASSSSQPRGRPPRRA